MQEGDLEREKGSEKKNVTQEERNRMRKRDGRNKRNEETKSE